jgi:hypothetical protein
LVLPSSHSCQSRTLMAWLGAPEPESTTGAPARPSLLESVRRRPISRARVLVRKPHTKRRQWLIRAITVGTVGVERRHNMQPSAAPTQEVVATRTTAMKPHKLSINSHRTRNLLPAILIGDVRNSPFRQHR